MKLLKIGAQLRVGVRRIWISFSESHPYADLFRQILHNLRAPPLGAGATWAPFQLFTDVESCANGPRDHSRRATSGDSSQ